MQLFQDLTEVIEMSGEPVARMEVFANHIPDEWVRIVATLSDKVTIRRRRLPADMVLWLVVGLFSAMNRSQKSPVS